MIWTLYKSSRETYPMPLISIKEPQLPITQKEEKKVEIPTDKMTRAPDEKHT